MKWIIASALLGLISCAHKVEIKSLTLEEAVQNPLRSEENKKRDIYRHPKETLSFFGIEPTMTVIEIWPSGGWYTEILAPYLAANGQYIIADPPADPNGYTNKRKQWLAAHPEIGSKVVTSNFLPPSHGDIAAPNTVDMILTFRNIHNWKDQPFAFKAFFKALKPGGVLGVVEHRANPKVKFNPQSGYVQQAEVIKMAKAAGFEVSGQSEINANSKDKTDYPQGVWTLPPTLRGDEANKDKYISIGESDRMTLRFVKPLI